MRAPLLAAHLALSANAPAEPPTVNPYPAPRTDNPDQFIGPNLPAQPEIHPGIYKSLPWTAIIVVPGTPARPIPSPAIPEVRNDGTAIEPQYTLFPLK
jgi:hypothetical protein